MEGKVKWFDVTKGFGFIITPDANEIYVHYTGIAVDGVKELEEGQDVVFEISEGKRGPEAIEVRVK